MTGAADLPLRGKRLYWRLAGVVLVVAGMLAWRMDIGTSWVFAVAVLVLLFRVPRVIRFLRRRDFLSTAPWAVLLAGFIGALVYQDWAAGVARDRFDALATQLDRQPCRAAAILSPVTRPAGRENAAWHEVRGGHFDYPLLVRGDPGRGTTMLTLHVSIDEVYSREVALKKCP